MKLAAKPCLRAMPRTSCLNSQVSSAIFMTSSECSRLISNCPTPASEIAVSASISMASQAS